MVVAGNSDKGLTLQYAPTGRTLPSAVIVSRAPQRCYLPRPTDVLAPRRRSHPSSQTASASSRAVGFARLGRGLSVSARPLALVSNITENGSSIDTVYPVGFQLAGIDVGESRCCEQPPCTALHAGTERRLCC